MLILDYIKYNNDMREGGVYLHFKVIPIAGKPIE